VSRLSEEEKKELLEMGSSLSLRLDMRRMEKFKFGLLLDKNGEVSLDRLNSFLTQYNAFINHRRRPFRRIKASNILL